MDNNYPINPTTAPKAGLPTTTGDQFRPQPSKPIDTMATKRHCEPMERDHHQLTITNPIGQGGSNSANQPTTFRSSTMSTNTAKCNVVATAITCLAFTFAHGSVVEVNNSDFSEETLAKFLQYGIKQKLQDSYSGQKDSKEAENALQALIERLKNGEWTAARASSGSASGVTKLVTAVVNLSGKSVAEVQAIIDALDDAQIKALKARPTVAAELARIRAEELAAKVAAEAGEEGGGLAGLF